MSVWLQRFAVHRGGPRYKDLPAYVHSYKPVSPCVVRDAVLLRIREHFFEFVYGRRVSRVRPGGDRCCVMAEAAPVGASGSALLSPRDSGQMSAGSDKLSERCVPTNALVPGSAELGRPSAAQPAFSAGEKEPVAVSDSDKVKLSVVDDMSVDEFVNKLWADAEEHVERVWAERALAKASADQHVPMEAEDTVPQVAEKAAVMRGGASGSDESGSGSDESGTGTGSSSGEQGSGSGAQQAGAAVAAGAGSGSGATQGSSDQVPAAPGVGVLAQAPQVYGSVSAETESAELQRQRAQIAELERQLEAARRGNVRPNADGARSYATAAKVTIKDVKLEKFSGNTDAEAHVISRDSFLPLLEWLDGAAFQMSVAGLPEHLHVRALLTHLSGAALKAFYARYQHRTAEVASWTMRDAKQAIASLVPESELLFTNTAIAMKFTATTMPDDIQKWGMYMRNGELAVDGSAFAFDQLQKKMMAAMPDIFTIAQSSYNLRLEKRQSFDLLISDAMQIVNALMVHDKLRVSDRVQAQRSERAKPVARNGNGGGVRKLGGAGGRKKGDKAPKGKSAATKSENIALAKKFNRCFGCGMYVPYGELDNHKARSKEQGGCAQDAEAFKRRMGTVRKMCADGKEDQVNVFPDKK